MSTNPMGFICVELPRLRVIGQRVDIGRQRAGREVRERDVLDDRAQVVAQRDPDALQRLGRAAVAHALRPLAAHRGERAVDGADHVGDGDLRRRPVELVPALRATHALDEPGVAQVGQDVLEEPLRDALGGRDRLGAHRRARVLGGGELGGGAHRVVSLGGDLHPRIVPISP